MKKFFKKLFKVLLILVLMLGAFVGGIQVGKNHNIENDNRQAYNKGYEAAKSLYYKPSSSTTKPVSETEAPATLKTSTSTETPKKEQESAESTIKVKVGSKTYTVRQSVIDELDAYEEYWDKYVETMKSAKNSDPISYLTKYTEMMQKIEEIDKHTSERDDLTKEEDSYYGYRIMEIYQKMLKAIQSLV